MEFQKYVITDNQVYKFATVFAAFKYTGKIMTRKGRHFALILHFNKYQFEMCTMKVIRSVLFSTIHGILYLDLIAQYENEMFSFPN